MSDSLNVRLTTAHLLILIPGLGLAMRLPLLSTYHFSAIVVKAENASGHVCDHVC